MIGPNFHHQQSDFLPQDKFQSTRAAFYPTSNTNDMKVNVNCKLEMHFDPKHQNQVNAFKQQCMEKHMSVKQSLNKMSSAFCQSGFKQRQCDLPNLPDLSIDGFSDVSGSDPDDLFSDLNSSLESLHQLEAFSFFSEKQNIAF